VLSSWQGNGVMRRKKIAKNEVFPLKTSSILKCDFAYCDLLLSSNGTPMNTMVHKFIVHCICCL
jgi:hypothetical protein